MFAQLINKLGANKCLRDSSLTYEAHFTNMINFNRNMDK